MHFHMHVGLQLCMHTHAHLHSPLVAGGTSVEYPALCTCACTHSTSSVALAFAPSFAPTPHLACHFTNLPHLSPHVYLACLCPTLGGLTSSATGVKAPRLQHFRRHLSAAQSYMHSTLETRQQLPCSQGCSTAAIKRLTKPVAYIAASPQVVSPRHRLLRMPAER